MDILDDAPLPMGNQPEYTVSELSGAVKRVIEGEFGLVRVRGEIGRVSRPASGHLYFDLKDANAVLGAVSWRGQAVRLAVKPEEGMEVIATGRMTTFPGSSKYQLVVEALEPAGVGALMAMLEKRRATLAAEGLFDAARKKPIPYLPGVIGVVTSPSGAVIRDILHRLRDRFPRHVLIWPVAVQGEKCAPEVAAAIRGFNALPVGGPVPRPDLLIVARGGGSMEDLWGFNEEIVVRAAAESRIPLISAVGHETDTTLIDHAADLRAPTPTAAAELAVPVRIDLAVALDELGARMLRAAGQARTMRRQRLTDLARALPRPETLVQGAGQRLDLASERLTQALRGQVQHRRLRLTEATGGLRAGTLLAGLGERRRHLDRVRLTEVLALRLADSKRGAQDTAMRLRRAEPLLPPRRDAVNRVADAISPAFLRWLDRRRERLEATDRLRVTLGYEATLDRGFALVRAGGSPVTTRTAALAGAAAGLEVQFRDGRLAVAPLAGDATSGPSAPVTPKPKARSGDGNSGGGNSGGGQGSLF
ncbi:MAG: exodeoxyribonuclease VII large subunit [Paracoccaceae bacterium]